MAAAVGTADAPRLAHGELKPPLGVKFGYSFGQFIESGYLVMAPFVFFYYTAVLGLPGSVVGAALAVSMVVDAVMDPLIGSFSDNVRSRFGRRLPLMVLGAPLMALSLGLLFAPPPGLAVPILFLWLTVTKFSLRAFASAFNLPYFALGAEMADGYVERSSIVAWRTMAGLMVTVLITGLAYSVFMPGPTGLQRQEGYPAFGWTAAGIFLAGAAICCAAAWRFAASLPQPTTPRRPFLRTLAREVIEIFRNPSFRALFLSALIAYVGSGLNSAFNSHSYVFVWRVTSGQIQTITYVFLAGIFVGVPLTPLLLRRLEKRSVVLLGLAGVMVAWTVLPLLRVFRVFTATGADAVPWLAGNVALAGVAIGFLAIAYPSMVADSTDEHEVKFGSRREGIYFAGLGFASKAAAGLGGLIAGVALDVIGFPKDIAQHVGTVLPEAMQDRVIIVWGPAAAVLGVTSMLVMLPYRITRRRHDEIVAVLKEKRALDVAEGRSS